MSLFERWRAQLERLHQDGRYRAMRARVGWDFSSNDYLGYSERSWPVCDLARSGTASRLLAGHQAIWDKLEDKLAAWHGAEAALFFSSGYAANEGLLSTIIEEGDLVFSDEGNHASIIDGLRLGRAEKIRFRHNDASDLEARLRERHARRRGDQAWFIVTESLFGMDGDVAPLERFAELADRFQAHLIVDEAHATGCFGETGSGLVDSLGLRKRVLATMHTGGKALGVTGAYVAGSRPLREILINRCRHFIYTTAPPPQIAAWWLDTLELVSADAQTRAALHERVLDFRKELSARRIVAGGTQYIVSIVLGTDAAATEGARRLQELGFDVRAIRPPTVPPGTARLRISVHADHEPAVLKELASTLASIVPLSS